MAVTIYEWGPGIYDLRGFNAFIKTPEEAAAFVKKHRYVLSNLISENKALEEIQTVIAKAPPGILFASNPHYGAYARWNHVLKRAGFKLVGGMCSINPVYGHKWHWKASGTYSSDTSESPDGYRHWIHAFYLVKPGAEKLAFDFSKRDPKAAGGDAENSLFHVNYRVFPGMKYQDYTPVYEDSFARLSGNCGAAMGMELPKHETADWYLTVAAIPETKRFPAGWRRFLMGNGLKFGHNLRKLEAVPLAQPCPHGLASGGA